VNSSQGLVVTHEGQTFAVTPCFGCRYQRGKKW
jgi:hypothetical protein